MTGSASAFDGFLSQSDPSRPASVNNGAWQKILDDQNLQLVTDDATLSSLSIDGSDAVVYMRWTPKAKGTELLSYDFSSERNSKYFEDDLVLESELKNSASIGDGSRCMLF
jgi:hypothetical protein